MTVAEFIAMDKGDTMYRCVDATVRGYMTSDAMLIEGDRNVAVELYGQRNLIGFSVATKRVVKLYIGKKEEV